MITKERNYIGKYDHLITFDPRPERPGKETDPSIMKKILWMDASLMHGAPYFVIMWFVKPREPAPPTHTHNFDEYIGFIGTDPNNAGDLGATVKFLIEDEWSVITKSAVLQYVRRWKMAPRQY